MTIQKFSGIFFITLLCSFSYNVAAQERTFVTDSIDYYIQKALITWNIPGAAVCIVKDGKVVLTKGYGHIVKNGEQAIDANTLFMIASNSKAFAGTALAKLEYEGKCKLDDKVITWLPSFAMHNTTLTTEATINDLLTHRMGYNTFQNDLLCFYSELTSTVLLKKFKQIEPQNDFRTRYGYSNFGYIWASECITAIAGEPWDRYIKNNFLSPLQMTRTQTTTKILQSLNNVAVGHTYNFDTLKAFPYPDADATALAAVMSSSANDLANWLLMWTNDGEFNGKEIVAPKVIERVMQPHTIIGRNGHPFNTTHYGLYGLGFRMADYENVEVISHSGGIWGFVSGVAFIPELNLGIAVLTNSDENWFYEALQWEIIDAYLNLPYRNYSDIYLRYYQFRQLKNTNLIKAYNDTVAMQNISEKAIRIYAGTYHNDLYGSITLTQSGNSLSMTMEHHPGITGKLEWMGNNKFLCTYNPSRMGVKVFPVTVKKDGSVELKLTVADRLDKTVWVFNKPANNHGN
ncbi:MAG: serine hydrolase [Bacteroidales bacterium]|nr:serine hydrolase [Bacteroidales bacterium]